MTACGNIQDCIKRIFFFSLVGLKFSLPKVEHKSEFVDGERNWKLINIDNLEGVVPQRDLEFFFRALCPHLDILRTIIVWIKYGTEHNRLLNTKFQVYNRVNKVAQI